MIKPSIEWVDSLVAKRRERGGYSDEELAAYRTELLAKYGLRDAPAQCEQNCGATATVYAIDPHPGGWGGRYCAACANALGFQVTDVL